MAWLTELKSMLRMMLKEIVATGQELEASTLLKAVKLYLDKRLDLYWGVVKEV